MSVDIVWGLESLYKHVVIIRWWETQEGVGGVSLVSEVERKDVAEVRKRMEGTQVIQEIAQKGT